MKIFAKFIFVISSFLLFNSHLQAQTCLDIPELDFSNPSWEASNTYRFPSVLPGVDAVVQIIGSSNTSLYSIDLIDTGDQLAFQPQVNLTTQNNNGTEGYMDFEITFVQANSSTPYVVNNWTITAADVDGDSHRMRESVGFSNFNAYTIETNSKLNLSDQSTATMTIFEAASVDNLPGITTDDTQHMVYLEFGGTSSFVIRTRIIDDGDIYGDLSDATDRMFSFFFDPCLINNFLVPNTLPVEFSYFEVEANDFGAVLNWETLLELNNDRFEIEKSQDGIIFSSIGSVEGAGNSYGKTNYRFIDTNPQEGVNYYRLKQIDFDGQFEYSELKSVNFSFENGNFSYKVYPNPATDFISISSPVTDEVMDVKLLDHTGKEISRKSLIEGRAEFEVSQIPAGIYHISLETENFRSKGKTVIIRR
ncbi:MAG: T9SS type A sorting domain-containing protein [Bacteroidia bacterium]|nr:T9SS type A sorting domain-containing protein [Bacteroidia bacterium]